MVRIEAQIRKIQKAKLVEVSTISW